MSSGCTTCRGECCRKYLVHLSGRDAVTIARGQRLAFESFVDIVSEDGPSSKGFVLDDSGDAFALCLQRHQDGACSFLMGLTDGSQRCGIYAERPLTCAIFPLRLFHGSVDIRSDVICEPNGRRITTVDLPAGHARLNRASFEWSVYGGVVTAGNAVHAHVRERIHERAYFAYVSAAYDAIDAVLEARQPVAMDHELEQALAAVLAPIAAG